MWVIKLKELLLGAGEVLVSCLTTFKQGDGLSSLRFGVGVGTTFLCVTDAGALGLANGPAWK